jgi:hypothetical protein
MISGRDSVNVILTSDALDKDIETLAHRFGWLLMPYFDIDVNFAINLSWLSFL